ncbi:ATP-grasp domain-containing protein [Candidatus Sulfurimonas marisnigri]|uniref:ATP-grasp domain-containing protein n=1 Tax=Candidatus Sulfurimonas marisnigri TaxID=2740405 RepID=A0A7S7M0U4_9BACT|nr:ATP-grasp domain-containing protein [Candidatus Sulfurimonas marisnigri]QOY55056.1 ATP-grasp domain-containing protein [Candidatus Sulfurimonas marisnigri]
MSKRTIGMWMYSNSGGAKIQEKIISKLRERDIEVISELDLRFARGSKAGITCNATNVLDLDLFFSYNAGEQTVAQVYMYETINKYIPTINSYKAFALSEDKFRTNLALSYAGVNTSDFFLCHKETSEYMVEKFKEWEKLVFKPVDGWGGNGMALLESRQSLNTLMPFLNKSDIRHIYLEKFIENDFTDFRIDIVDGEFVSCYGRRANDREWRTNITSGGSIILREANDEIVGIAKKATKALGMDIAGVDILYDKKEEKYVVLEVNGIPAFATPEQEKMGLDFNDKKIDLLVNLIDRKTKLG